MEEKKYMTLEDLTELSETKYMELMKNNQVKDLLRAIGLFTDQTITNDGLILAQKPEATCVKRMKDWNFYSRVVKKAEKAIKVISHYLNKYDVDYKDERGNVYTQGTENLRHDVGYVFDISQTDGKEYDYLNSNKENIAKHFEVVKKALESTAKEFTFEYRDQESNSQIDMENKKVFIKDGLSVNEVIAELIDNVSQILLKTRHAEGLENIDEFEKNSVIYAVNSKLGLDLPEYDFAVDNLNDEDLIKLKDNFQKVRSVTKQMLSNVETAIEKAIRNLDKQMADEEAKLEEKQETSTPKKTRKKTQETEREVV